MIKQNKIISLAIIGLVLGGIVGAVVNSEQANMATLAAYGGIIGFLAGWIWNSRSSTSDNSDSDGSEE
jgi:drug/metabolite transporter superfamily protein YnfA